jgi:RNA polymerase sigma factor (sigma-70 family)
MATEVREISRSAKTDLELVRTIRTKSGIESQRAYSRLVNKYRNSMIFRFRGMVNNEDDAFELTQEAFAKMVANLEKFDETNAAFSTWLFKMTRNIFVDFLRKKREHVTSLSDLATYDDENNVTEFNISARDKTPDEIILTKERNLAMKNILNKMDKPELLKVIKMRYFDELSYEEIAEKTGKPLGTVKVYMKRAKESLRIEFSKAGITM